MNFIKKKIDARIKGRTRAIGSIQRRYLKYGETVLSPTVSLEVLFATLLYNAHKGRNVFIFDVSGVFLHIELPIDNCFHDTVR